MTVCALMILVPACRSGESTTNLSSESSPFSVAEPPEGYRLVTAGRGRQTAIWGGDEYGTDEPFTVLAPTGADATDPASIIVSITGFEGYQGGLDQAARGYIAATHEDLEINGRRAIYTRSQQTRRGTTWADLVAVRGDDLAVRVGSITAAKAELIDVLHRVELSGGRSRAPSVPEPPPGYEVLGSVGADVVVGFSPEVAANSDAIPGTSAAHAAAWIGEGRRALAVMTLPGDAAALDALSGYGEFVQFDQFTANRINVGQQPGVILDIASLVDGAPRFERRILAATTDWGDVLLVVATGEAVPPVEVLTAFAATVRRANSSAWERFVVEAGGGPGLHADTDGSELLRGRAGGLEWLLQDKAVVQLAPGSPAALPERCLKLSNRRRVCADTTTGAPDGQSVSSARETLTREGAEFDFPGFVIVTTRVPGSSVRVTTETDVATGSLVAVPGTDLLTAVVFVNAPGVAVCVDPLPPSEGVDAMRVDVLNAAGMTIGCVGF
jgi:hypothetical protein